jgi:hypothetical protein
VAANESSEYEWRRTQKLKIRTRKLKKRQK